jgi:hypothetical protein
LANAALLVVALAGALLLAYGLAVRHGVALSDEYVYVAGARYLADTGSLHARYYSANAILAQGHPHQDMHPPGYVLLLGGLTRLLPFGYWTAVLLNVAAYLGGALAVRSLSRSLGVGERGATAAGIVFLFLPGYLPYVYWALPEVLVGALLAVVAAVTGRAGSRAGGRGRRSCLRPGPARARVRDLRPAGGPGAGRRPQAREGLLRRRGPHDPVRLRPPVSSPRGRRDQLLAADGHR